MTDFFIFVPQLSIFIRYIFRRLQSGSAAGLEPQYATLLLTLKSLRAELSKSNKTLPPSFISHRFGYTIQNENKKCQGKREKSFSFRVLGFGFAIKEDRAFYPESLFCWPILVPALPFCGFAVAHFQRSNGFWSLPPGLTAWADEGRPDWGFVMIIFLPGKSHRPRLKSLPHGLLFP